MDSAQAEILVSGLLGETVGGWKVETFLGKGKSAVVMAATSGSQEGAIKVFHPELVERYGRATQHARILREKNLVGAKHPNLVQIFDGGECPSTGHLYVVMERLPASNMHDLLGKIPAHAVPLLIAQVASAARFLEDRGLAHRDIKPENIAVSDDFSSATLLDLGVLRPIGLSDLTDIDQRSFIGTLRYSSPEFLQREEEDTLEGWRAVNFYQLGAVLHDLLMGRVLFQEDSEPFSMLVRAVLEKTPVIHAINARCVTLANHCLLKNPKTRIELVNWERFQALDSDDGGAASAARERIKQRQKYVQASLSQSKPAERSTRLSRKALDDVCNRVGSRIAALMNDLQVFPLRATRSIKDVENGVCETCIHFEEDEQKGVAFKLAVMIRLTVIDQNAGSALFEASASAGLSRREMLPAELPEASPFLSGELELILDSTEFETVFLACLDESYLRTETGNVPTGNEVIGLGIKEYKQ